MPCREERHDLADELGLGERVVAGVALGDERGQQVVVRVGSPLGDQPLTELVELDTTLRGGQMAVRVEAAPLELDVAGHPVGDLALVGARDADQLADRPQWERMRERRVEVARPIGLDVVDELVGERAQPVLEASNPFQRERVLHEAPQPLMARRVAREEVHLLWVRHSGKDLGHLRRRRRERLAAASAGEGGVVAQHPGDVVVAGDDPRVEHLAAECRALPSRPRPHRVRIVELRAVERVVHRSEVGVCPGFGAHHTLPVAATGVSSDVTSWWMGRTSLRVRPSASRTGASEIVKNVVGSIASTSNAAHDGTASMSPRPNS